MPQFSFCFPFGSPWAQGLKLRVFPSFMSTKVPSASSSLNPVQATHFGQAHPSSSGILSIWEKSFSLISALVITDDFPLYFLHKCFASVIVRDHGKIISTGSDPKHISVPFISFFHSFLSLIHDKTLDALYCLKRRLPLTSTYTQFHIHFSNHLQVLHAIISFVVNAIFQTTKSPTLVPSLLTQGCALL